jgi:hypothetical protein
MEPTEGITVRVGIFSGRPNPELTLVDDAADRVVNLLREAIGSQPTHEQPRPKLGRYHGFHLSVAPRLAKASGLPAHASVYEGVITQPDTKSDAGWRDVGGLEAYLLEQTVHADYGDLLERVGVDISQYREPGAES